MKTKKVYLLLSALLLTIVGVSLSGCGMSNVKTYTPPNAMSFTKFKRVIHIVAANADVKIKFTDIFHRYYLNPKSPYAKDFFICNEVGVQQQGLSSYDRSIIRKYGCTPNSYLNRYQNRVWNTNNKLNMPKKLNKKKYKHILFNMLRAAGCLVSYRKSNKTYYVAAFDDGGKYLRNFNRLVISHYNSYTSYFYDQNSLKRYNHKLNIIEIPFKFVKAFYQSKHLPLSSLN